jgi:hypothetical protein
MIKCLMNYRLTYVGFSRLQVFVKKRTSQTVNTLPGVSGGTDFGLFVILVLFCVKTGFKQILIIFYRLKRLEVRPLPLEEMFLKKLMLNL